MTVITDDCARATREEYETTLFRLIVAYSRYTVAIYIESYVHVVLQLTPASSKWAQLCEPIPLLGQSTSLASVPVHCTLSRRMAPVPCPKKANERAIASVEKIGFYIIPRYSTYNVAIRSASVKRQIFSLGVFTVRLSF